MNDPLQDAGLGVDFTETVPAWAESEPAELDETKHETEGIGTALLYALGVVSLIAVGFMAI